jgi:hypothetical protein
MASSEKSSNQANRPIKGRAARAVSALALALFLSAATVQAQQGQAQQRQAQAQQRQQQDPQQSQAQQSPNPTQQGPTAAPQDQNQDQTPNQQADQQPPAQANRPDAPPSSSPNGPTYYPQDGPVYENGDNSRGGQSAPEQNAPPTTRQSRPPYGHGPQGSQQNVEPAPPAGLPLPATLTIPAKTILYVRINEPLSSDHNQVGDRVTATLEKPLVVNGWVVVRRGQTLTGQVTAAVKAGRIKGTSQLGIELTDLTLVDGQSMPILTEMWRGSGGTSHGQDAATIGGTTALGAAIGAAADWGRGAAIGAGAGAAAGIGAVLLTRGRPTVIEPETPLTFRLVDPVKVDTTQGQQAFAPVSQEDYDGGRGRAERRSPHLAGAYPPPYACGYYDPCYVYPGYAYPGYYPYAGFWWGPTFYYRGGFGHRGFRR